MTQVNNTLKEVYALQLCRITQESHGKVLVRFVSEVAILSGDFSVINFMITCIQ